MTTEYGNGVSHESSNLSKTVDIQEEQDDLEVDETNISSTALPAADSTSMLSVETVTPSTDDIEEEEKKKKKKKKKKKWKKKWKKKKWKKKICAMHHLLIQC